MNYISHYVKLVRKAQVRNAPNCYTENHHVFPVSIFGENNFTVELTAKEHYIAHWLLYKASIKRYGVNHRKTHSLAKAWNNMTFNHSGKRYVSKTFSLAREARAISILGNGNPAKSSTARQKISKSKSGKLRPDMKGKSYFGADEIAIQLGIEKMKAKKTGMKINYPSNRKSSPCSEEKAKKISRARKETEIKFKNMSDDEFSEWLLAQSIYCSNGKRKNPNVTRTLQWRGIPIEKVYDTV